MNFVSVNRSLFEDYKNIKTHSYLTIAAYYGLKAASLLSELDKIIYLDCDVIVNFSLKSLFNTDIDKYALAAIQDINKKNAKEKSKIF